MSPNNRWSDPDLERRVETMEERLARGDSRMGAIERDIRENTDATAEILEIVRMGKSFFKVLGHAGRALKWVSTTAAACGAIWAIWTHRT